MEEKAIEVVFSFVASDQAFYELVRQHLAALRRAVKITCWSSLDAQNEDEMRQHIESAQIIMPLISSAYLDSDQHYQNELTRGLERHRAGEARMIPLLVRPCYFNDLPFAVLQMLPTGARPLSKIPEEQRDQVYCEIAQNIDRLLQR